MTQSSSLSCAHSHHATNRVEVLLRNLIDWAFKFAKSHFEDRTGFRQTHVEEFLDMWRFALALEKPTHTETLLECFKLLHELPKRATPYEQSKVDDWIRQGSDEYKLEFFGERERHTRAVEHAIRRTTFDIGQVQAFVLHQFIERLQVLKGECDRAAGVQYLQQMSKSITECLQSSKHLMSPRTDLKVALKPTNHQNKS